MRIRLAASLLASLAAAPSLLAAQGSGDGPLPSPSLPGGVLHPGDFAVSMAPAAVTGQLGPADQTSPAALPPPPGSAVPEPATLLLVGAGVLSVGALRRRRRA